MAQAKIALIILNWNGLKDTLECLSSLSKSDRQDTTVYVVDNHSSQDEAAVIAGLHPWVKVIRNSANLGFSGGNNVGIKAALKDHAQSVILLNNDTQVAPDTLAKLVAASIKYHFDIASPKIYFYKGREFHPVPAPEQGKIIWYAGGIMDWANVIATHRGVNEFDHGQYDRAEATDFATGCCMFIAKQLFARIGFLDEAFTAYYEDNDFCQRAHRAGFKIGYLPQSHLWHRNASATGGSGSTVQNPLIKKSRLTFALRHAPPRAKIALLREHFFS